LQPSSFVFVCCSRACEGSSRVVPSILVGCCARAAIGHAAAAEKREEIAPSHS
jgi:hypothetical protein